MEKFVKTRLLALIGLACLLLAVFLPYFKVSFFGFGASVSLIQAWQGWVILILGVVYLAFVFRDYLKKMIPGLFKTGFGKWLEKADMRFALIPVGLILLIALFSGVTGEVGSYGHYSIGFYLLWVAVVALVVFPFIYKAKKSSKK